MYQQERHQEKGKRKRPPVNNIFFEKLINICHDLIYYDVKLFNYLKNRGITPKIIEEYKIGAFPKDLRILLNSNISGKDLIQNGIIYNASKTPFKHHPIIIPIKDAYGNVVAIGCRTLLNKDEMEKHNIPKYLNSVYKKTAHLFNLDKAISTIKQKDRVIIVEGYFDAISSFKAGVKNVVATCGTLLAKRQVAILSRYTDNMVLLFDNDDAGKNNATKIIEKFSDSVISPNITCAFTPDGYKDIDEYIRKTGDLAFFDKI